MNIMVKDYPTKDHYEEAIERVNRVLSALADMSAKELEVILWHVEWRLKQEKN